MTGRADGRWEAATWEGSRREKLRAALTLTVRERLQALEALSELAKRLAEMPRSQGASAEK
jgi:hypothetical protein